MADRATPGQDILDSPLGSAGVQNLVLDAAYDHALRKRMGEGVPSNPFTVPTDLIKVKNVSGSGLPLGSVVQLGSRVLTAIQRDKIWIEADAPTVQGTPQCAIVLQDIPADEIMPAQVQGVCVARVIVNHIADQCCYVKAGQLTLESCAIGHHRILHTLTSTGEQRCFVSLGDGVLTCLGEAAAAIASADSGTVNVKVGPGGAETPTGQTIPGCWNHAPDIEAGQTVTAGILHGEFYVSGLECGA